MLSKARAGITVEGMGRFTGQSRQPREAKIKKEKGQDQASKDMQDADRQQENPVGRLRTDD